jgi:hypothetical protein
MSDDPFDEFAAQDPEVPQQIQFQIQLPPELEQGVFADYANVWHTPNTFVLDFVAVKMPAHPPMDPQTGQVVPGPPVLEARVGARIRIPSEQIFPLIAALQEQGNQWLAETGRSVPPESWLTA